MHGASKRSKFVRRYCSLPAVVSRGDCDGDSDDKESGVPLFCVIRSDECSFNGETGHVQLVSLTGLHEPS